MKNLSIRPYLHPRSISWKHTMARLMYLPGMAWAMRWGVKIVVPRHRVGVALVALDDENRVFLLHHVFHPAAPWGLPAGWLERKESPADGILRELREETGLTAVLGQPLSIEYSDIANHIGIVYTGRIQPGTPQLSGEILAAEWFPVDQLPDDMLPFTRDMIETAVAVKHKEKMQ
ncbi:MAG: NUDIX domain-containing protein [Chloroflexi bacterium]|nr:NUDIX domain-containing protein [Chloroflexota bacterium]